MKTVRIRFFGLLCLSALAVLFLQNVSLHCLQCAPTASVLAIEPDCHHCAEHAGDHDELPSGDHCAVHNSPEVLQPTRDSSVEMRAAVALCGVAGCDFIPLAATGSPITFDPSPPNGAFKPALAIILLC